MDAGTAIGARLVAKEHQDAAVGRPSRTLVVKAFGENALARPVGLHDPDQELARQLLCKRDVVASRRPDRGRIAAIIKADATDARPVGAHDIELLRTLPVRLENDLAAVGRIAWTRIDAGSLRQLPGLSRPQVHFDDARIAARLKAHHNALAVGGKARRKGHARKIADKLAFAGLEVHE